MRFLGVDVCPAASTRRHQLQLHHHGMSAELAAGDGRFGRHARGEGAAV